tara:strand:- start:14 stop:169 length:156 start_codon:yes stop_codon:yes gene_type:complete
MLKQAEKVVAEIVVELEQDKMQLIILVVEEVVVVIHNQIIILVVLVDQESL